MKATYTKLRTGDWGLRIEGARVGEGTPVVVVKRSGERKSERVGRVVWSGNGVTLATISRSATRRTSRRDPDQPIVHRAPGGAVWFEY